MLIRTQNIVSTFCLVSKVQDSSLSSDKPLLNGAFCVMEPEVWKDVSGFENYYQISSHGGLRSKDRIVIRRGKGSFFKKGRIIKLSTDLGGYRIYPLKVRGNQYTKRINILVATEFVPNPGNKPLVGHIDNDPTNNYYKNLVWCTQSENMQHAIKCGRKNMPGKGVVQMDLDGNIIRRFKRIAHVSELGFCKQNIGAVAMGKQKTAYGFLWKYAD